MNNNGNIQQEQGKKYGPYDAPYWRRRWDLEEAKYKREQALKVDFSQVVTTAYEYMIAYQDYRRAAADRRKTGKEVDKAYWNQEKYYSVMWAVCISTGIPQGVAMAAARIEDRYYSEHGGGLSVDYEQLIKALI